MIPPDYGTRIVQTANFTPSRNPRVEEAPLQSELMLFEPESAKFFVLNSTMAFLWRHADGKRSLGDIARTIVDSFQGADPAKVEADVSQAAEELKNMGLLIDSAP